MDGVTALADNEVAYTIDELAAAAGVPSRTVRHYQSQGALPPPRRQGRMAVYGPAHLERLELIGRLQDRGLRLDAIRDALREVERGHISLEAWLGLGEQVRAPWSDDSPLLLSTAQLTEQFGELPPGLLTTLMQYGLVRSAEGGANLVPSPRMLRVALALREAAIDMPTVAGAIDVLRKQQRRAADEFVGYLLDRLGNGFAGSGTLQELAATIGALRASSLEAVNLLFGQEMERTLQVDFDEHQPRFVRQKSKA